MIDANDRKDWGEQITKLQEPVQYCVMALLSILKSQKESFKAKELYSIYLTCVKTQLDKDFAKLQGDSNEQ